MLPSLWCRSQQQFTSKRTFSSKWKISVQLLPSLLVHCFKSGGICLQLLYLHLLFFPRDLNLGECMVVKALKTVSSCTKGRHFYKFSALSVKSSYIAKIWALIVRQFAPIASKHSNVLEKKNLRINKSPQFYYRHTPTYQLTMR